MSLRFGGVLGALLVVTVGSVAHAQCTKDLDCEGEQVCEAGQCVAPSATPPATPALPVTVPAPTAPVTASASATAPAPWEDAPTPPRRRRYSTGMMVGGIVLVSLAPIALLVAGASSFAHQNCDANHSDPGRCDEYDVTTYGGLILGVGLAGAGIPLIVIGAKKEPVQESEVTATVAPWATPSAVGLGLRVDL